MDGLVIPVASTLLLEHRRGNWLWEGNQECLPHLLCLLSGLASPVLFMSARKPDLVSTLVQHTLFYHVMEHHPIQVYFAELSHLSMFRSCPLQFRSVGGIIAATRD